MKRVPTRRVLDVLGGLVFALLVLVPSVTGFGALPALGAALNPGTGVWRLAADAGTAQSGDLALPGLKHPATVSFEDNGLAHVKAGDDQDLFRTIGYLHARFRLVQMDLTRRQANGTLSEVIGAATLEVDRFQRDLGVRRAAELDWRAMAAGNPARETLQSYSDGVNAAMRELRAGNRLPTQFTVLGYEPDDWTPVDSLAVQRLVGQKISFDSQAPLFSYAEKAMGREAFKEWFPDVPENKQHPYDKGPFKKLPLTPLPQRSFPDPADSGTKAGAAGQTKPTSPVALGAGTELAPLLEKLGQLPDSGMGAMGHSNSWVVAGSRTESGKPILSADPHLPHSLPSIWYQVEGSSPGYHFSGVTMPGLPVPLLGKTDEFSWGLTASQRPTTLYYLEKTEEGRPDEYFSKGAWQPMTLLREKIAVRGQSDVDHTIKLTAHGPVMEVEGVTASVWWAGTLPNDNLRSMLTMLRAKNVGEFRDSLRDWVTPALNFSYADRHGDIAMFNAGVAPQVDGHEPTLPLPGDGTAEITGSIPFEALPSSVNPAEGYIVSANQREVTGDYPYQYSSSYNWVLHGWRDGEIVDRITSAGKLSFAETAAMQSDWHDNNARQLIPLLLDALQGEQLSAAEQQVVDMVRAWDFNATPESLAPAFFDSFKNRVSWVTFEPWWKHYGVKQNPGQYLLPKGPDAGAWAQETLRGTVLGWIQHDPDNKYFSLPDGTKRTTTQVLREAFHQSAKRTADKYGADLLGWRYDKYQKVLFPSLLGISALDVGPLPWGGNPRTINTSVGTRDDSDGNPLSHLATAGPTWRLNVDWGTGEVNAIFPAGQSENPMSPWYANGVPVWMKGQFWPVLENDAVRATAEWRLQP